jgi:hypothetical protein
VSFRDLRRQLDYFLEVVAGGGKVAALDRGVAGVKGVVGLMKLLLPVWLLAGRGLCPSALG